MGETENNPTGETESSGQEQNAGEGEGGQVAADQNAQREPQEETASIPISVVQKMRQELKDAKDRAQKAEQQVNQASQQAPQKTAPAQESDDPLANLEDDDLLDAKTARKIVQQQSKQNQQAFSELQVRSQFQDYDDVIQNQLPKVIEEKPYLKEAIMSSQNPYVLAYELGKSAKAKTDQNSQEQGTLEQQLDKYANTPGSPSQTSGQGGPTSGADHYANLSMEDLDKEIAKAKRGE